MQIPCQFEWIFPPRIDFNGYTEQAESRYRIIYSTPEPGTELDHAEIGASNAILYFPLATNHCPNVAGRLAVELCADSYAPSVGHDRGSRR